MEVKVSFFCSDGTNYVGEALITESELVVYEKNTRTAGMLFGVVGGLIADAVAKREEVWRVDIDEIVKVERKRFRLNRNGCYITLKSFGTCVALFQYPDETIDYLESVVAKKHGESD